MDILNSVEDAIENALDGLHSLRTHTVRYGETLTGLSQQYYGTPKYSLVIWQHNRDKITEPQNIYQGQVLVIPHLHPSHYGNG